MGKNVLELLMSGLCLYLLHFQMHFDSGVTSPVETLQSGFCPLIVCGCDFTGTVLDCSGAELSSVDNVIISNVLGSEPAKNCLSSVNFLNLDSNILHDLPVPEDLLIFLPNLVEISLSANNEFDCDQVDLYRKKFITVQSDRCPDDLQSEVVNITPFVPSAPLQQIRKPEVPTKSPNTAAVQTEESTRIPSTQKPILIRQNPTESSENQTASGSIAWTVIFLNCCFVGISGMIIGALLTVLLPVLWRFLVRFAQRYSSQNGGYAKLSTMDPPPFYVPPAAYASKSGPGTGKRIIPNNDL
ncbi:uncharacterized protein LOC129597587 [Paramacrobiotus metropolitanus]|uniref:uncharacterized protein LOC129597587 n=1 Tax=Paramacrobiotus metropolitanus TaxID=2943436 RepID=UPI0024461827|nr:uncharacterized protein LOC129597587 [Paramacrobiotus metropolitanus]